MSRVSSTEFVALTGTTLPDLTVTAILDAADVMADDAVYTLGNPSLSANTLNNAAMLFAKALLVDRYRLDGTFDASTTDYSHKGNTEGMITGYKEQALKLLKDEAQNTITWVQKANR